MRLAGLFAVILVTFGLPSVAQAGETSAIKLIPSPVLSNGNLWMGDVPLGQTGEGSVGLKNVSSASVTLGRSTWRLSGYPYSLGECDHQTLAPGATCVDSVRWATDRDMLNVYTTADVEFDLSDGSYAIQPVEIRAVPPPPSVEQTRLTPRFFFPLVQDGYRDKAVYKYRLNTPATGAVQIVNRRGKVVKSVPFKNRSSGRVAWRGDTNKGGKVKPGHYRFRVKAHANGASVISGFDSVRVRTGWRKVRHTKARRGRYASGHYCHTRGGLASGCHLSPYGSEWWLQAFDRSKAFAYYNFNIPRSAVGLSGKAYVDWHNGPWKKSVSRPSPNVLRVTVHVPSNAAATVARVRVTYFTKRRV